MIFCDLYTLIIQNNALSHLALPHYALVCIFIYKHAYFTYICFDFSWNLCIFAIVFKRIILNSKIF